jgi:competence protein ComEC
VDVGRIGPVQWLRERARRALATGFPSNRALDHALLRALVLGDSDPELRDVQEQFRRTGTSHHLAISGMHIAVLGGVVFGVCRLLRLHPRTACWISLLFVILYGVVALPSPPVVRSVLLCVSFAIGILWKRSIDAIQLLAVSVLAMLVYHPLDLYNAGFQLSFGTVLGLMIFTKPAMRALGQRDLDQQIAHAMQRPGRLSVLKLKLAHHARATLAAGAVAWLVSMPLIALHFEQLNPWAILASIVLAPIVFLALIGGFLKIILTLLWPGLAGAWASLAAAPVAGMRHAVDWLATFPGADVPMPAPAIWSILLFYALLIAPLVPWPSLRTRWGARLASAAGCATLCVLTLGANRAHATAPRNGLTMTLLAIGAGQCAVIEPPDADPVLVDAGSATLSDLVRKCLGPFLRHQGRRGIARVLITHANYDHFGAVAEIAAAYDVREIDATPQFAAQSVGNPPAEGMLRTLDALDRAPRTLRAGDRVNLGDGACGEVLWPTATCPFDANNTSLVIRVTFADKTILFTGDIQSRAMRELLGSGESLKADILIAPHHGSGEDATAAFIAAVDPQLILSSNDRTLSIRQRDFEQLTGGRPLLRTNRCGAITVHIAPDGKLNVTTFLPQAKEEMQPRSREGAKNGHEG